MAFQAALAQSWQRVLTNGPAGAGVPILLTDGSVMVHHFDAADWWKLTPDVNGDYVHGTWSRLADLPVGYGPLYFASAVLRDGRVVIMGGEYNFGSAVWTNRGAIYDPDANTWTSLAAPAGWSNIGDAQCSVMPDGKFYLANPFDTRMASLDPTTLTWTALNGAGKIDRFDEEGWTLMPDGTLLTVDAIGNPHCEKYIPATNTWVSAGNTPQTLVHAASQEMGPVALLPNGTALAIGATGHNAIYTPGVNAADPGSWVSAPDLPLLNGLQLVVADGPCCLLPGGNVLTSASPGIFVSPTKFFEFDGSSWIPVPETPGSPGNPCYVGNMLVLPNGQVMYTDFSSDVEIYSPLGTPQEAWRPTISNCPATIVGGQTFTITGTQFNGLSQCCFYGDDSANSTNYPLVRVTNLQSGHVQYCKTLNHSTMAVATGTLPTSTTVIVPATLEEGPSRLEVVTNGIASAPFLINSGNTISVPRLRKIAPETIQANELDFTLNAIVIKSRSDDILVWINAGIQTPLVTSFVTSQGLSAIVPTNLITIPGTYRIGVRGSNGKLSNTLPFTVTSDVPQITSLSPTTTVAAGPDFVLSINGLRFNDRNTVTWTLNGVPTQLATTYVSPTQLTAIVPAAAYVNFGTATVAVKTALGVTSNLASFSVTSNLPQISSLSPASVQAGGPDFILTLNGIRFKNTDTVRWLINGVRTSLVTSFVSSTQLTAVVPAAQTFNFGAATVDVINSIGQASNGVAFTVTTDVPQISTVAPASIAAFGPDTAVTLAGVRFKATDTVRLTKGVQTINLAATFVSGVRWDAIVPASVLASGGTATVSVVDFRGRSSNGVAISIVNPLPNLTSISPTNCALDSAAFTMSLTGDHFVPGISVEWRNGNSHIPLATTFISQTQLTALVPASLLTVAGSYNILVINPAPGGGEGNSIRFDVLDSPVLTSLSPDNGTVGVGLTLRLRGTGFLPGAVVNFDGTMIGTTYVSDRELMAFIPGSALPEPIVLDVSVINPGNIETDPLPFTIRAPEPFAWSDSGQGALAFTGDLDSLLDLG